ncbi:MAG: cob(I)yrinic acid a,c-diamide adenosyltransferase [Butyrivibrio sp.]|nr:cob(I)yrinic acid a,c-diamide adenosyltransferase [Butyrivibrio sp.]
MGLIHLYTGDGKGKTTAAIGLAVRAAGAGKKVVFAQFMKGRETSELKILSNVPEITIIRNDKDLGWFKKDDEVQGRAYTEAHNRILDEIETFIMNGQCDVLILDEATYPYNYGIIDKERLENLLLLGKDHEEADGKSEADERSPEIVVTGRDADSFFTDRADYITEMKKIRHPYDKGIDGRLGIEF